MSHFPCWLVLMPAVVLAAEPGRPMPPELARYPTLISACADYQQRLAQAGWQTVTDEDFQQGLPDGWRAVETDNVTATVELRQVDGQPVVALVAPANGSGLLQAGRKVAGALAIEIEALADTDRPCDISLFLDGIGQGPAFQFGALRNTRNILYVDQAGTTTHRAVDLDRHPRIRPRTWHRVRLTIHDGAVAGWVDDQLVGRQQLSADYDLARPRQPLVYTFDAPLLIRRLKVQHFRPNTLAAAQTAAWQAAFGARTDAEVRADLDRLVELLDHERYAVREGAQRLLERAGALAEPGLRAARLQGTVEQQIRAREILGE